MVIPQLAIAGVHSNQDLIWCVKKRGIYGVLGPSWVLITYNICPPVNSTVPLRTGATTAFFPFPSIGALNL